jgi:hypothetical protein
VLRVLHNVFVPPLPRNAQKRTKKKGGGGGGRGVGGRVNDLANARGGVRRFCLGAPRCPPSAERDCPLAKRSRTTHTHTRGTKGAAGKITPSRRTTAPGPARPSRPKQTQKSTHVHIFFAFSDGLSAGGEPPTPPLLPPLPYFHNNPMPIFFYKQGEPKKEKKIRCTYLACLPTYLPTYFF